MKTNSKVSKRIISLVLTILLVLSMVPMSVFSAFAEEVSELAEGLPELSATIDTGAEVALSDADGDGYYDISTANELYAFAALVNGGNLSLNAELTADIVVNEGVMSAESTDARAWTPIGNDSNSYTGTFDGNNKTVSGLYFNNSEADYIGLFGFVGENGAVKNTGVINSYFNGYYYVGGVAGENYYGTITNCYNTGFVSGFYEVGSVVGMNYGTITNCYNTGFVSGAYDVGGVVGYNYKGTITNCYNTGFVSGSSYYVGGVAGDNYYGTITNCYNTGEVSGVYYIGGVAGDSYYGTITNCYYLDTAYTGGIGLNNSPAADDVAGSAEAKTAEQFKSGEVAYLLQGTQEELVWGQKIGTDELPTLGGDKVYYGYYSCADDVAEYTNNSNVVAEKPDHNFVNGSCTACGVNALFYAERTVDYDGDVSDESKYFMQLEDALRYAEKSTQNITTYYSECATVKILCNYAIDESVTVTVPSNVTLDLNGFELTNNGTINFESIDGFKVSGGNYTGDGTVKIDEYDGIIFENTLYYFGGEYTPGYSDKRDLAQEKDRTYFTAGEGYAVYKNADGAVLNLYNATIYSNESAQSGAYTNAIYYSGIDSLTVNFYGENNLYSKAAADVAGINAYFGLVLNGLGENPIININCENATAFSNGISGTDITINSGIVNIDIDNSGEYCIGIDGENITVANDAEINITTGDASRRSVGIYANSSIVNEGEINTSFGEADTSAGVMVTGTDKISNKGTMNALVLQRIATDDVINDDYYTSGNVVVNKGFSPFNEEEYNHAFTVAEGTSLLINEDASFDLSILSAEDITIEGEVAVDGRLILPEGVSVLDIKDKITSATDDGTVRVGDNTYCFENGKLKCTSEECHLTADDSTNVANCKRKTVCDICGAEYGDIDEFNHAGKRIPEFTFETPYETEDSKECYVELNLICEDCGECVETQSGYAKLTESAEGTDCLNLGYELYEVTFDIDGVEYTGTNKVTVKSDNHVGEFVNGFCSECGGYQPAKLNDNGTPDDEWDDYYEISNAGQLYWFAEHAINDQYARAVLTDDIIVNEDLNAENLREWISIGESSSMPYCGSFDGQGHTISGLYAKSELNYIGLFGAIGWGAEISNLGIKDSYFEGNYYVGGIVGYNDFSYIKNCYAENVEIVAVGSGAALVGYNYGEVSNSYSTSGIIADTDYGTITNCYYLADVETEDGGKTAEQFASGEVAYLLQSGVVGEEIWDDELGEYVQTEPEHIWGQKIGEDTYPVFGGDKVYQVENCIGDSVYSNANENGQHNFVNGFCTLCGGFEPATLNEDGVYEIGNAGQLYWFADKVNNDYENFGSANAILTADIVVNEGVMTAESTDARAWTPIGNNSNRYTGTFDGNNKTVSGLYFNNTDTKYVGLFGYIGENGTVKNTGVINLYFNGLWFVGGVVGANYGTITNCYNTGEVSGVYFTGGIVGQNCGTITRSYNTGIIEGFEYIGGVVGSNNGTITNCYNIGEVSGSYEVGGVVGKNSEGIISNCYNTGEVSSANDYIGGVAGANQTGTITNCYYLDTAYEGGIGKNNTVEAEDIVGSAEAKTAEQFASGEVAYLLQGEQTEEIWGQKISTDTYPVFGGDKVYYGYITCDEADNTIGYTNLVTSEEAKLEHNFVNGFCTLCGEYQSATDENNDGVYEIGNAGQLYWFAESVNSGNTSANAILTADIVVNEGTISAESTDARAWTPIGSYDNNYTGTFDGNGKTVSGLYFNNTVTEYVGLFGCIGKNGAVKNTGVINSYFNGYLYVGGVAGGNNAGTITNCYNTGVVSGENYIGGVVGYAPNGAITNCYNTGELSGENYIGGVVGYTPNGAITNCYNTGKVSGDFSIGGVVGHNDYYGKITNCYNAGEVSGTYCIGGVVGYTPNGKITNCYNTGEVSGSEVVGGVVGRYLDGTITNCYYLNTACSGGIDGADVAGSAEAKTAEQFASGEVAYLLQGEQTEDVWGQKIGTDELPTLGGDKVYYGYDSCADDVAEYTNNSNVVAEKPDHNYVNGFCTVCGRFEPATDENNDGVYEIGNAGQLYWFAESVNSGNTSANAILTADIVVNEGVMTAESEGARVWTPIGNFNSKYSGSFDGNNKTVSGLYLNESSKWYVGLFGFVYNGTVKNTGVINSYFCGRSDVGAIVGACNSGEIINCYNESIVVGDSYTGGVAGYNEDSTMTDCYNSGNVSGNYRIAGVVGFNQRSIISNTYNTGVIGNGECVGGIVGESDGGAIESCYNAGEIIGRDTYRVGGIIGQNRDGSVDNCYNIGTVDGTDSMFVGGIAGKNIEGTITNCYYLNTACEGGIDGSDLAGSAEAKTAEQFKSGEVAYLLQGEQEELVWGQKIGTDTYPVLGGDKVYAVKDSQGNITGYSNTNESDVTATDKLAGYSISLGDKIAVNYYMSLTDKTLNDANAKMVFTVPDTGSTYTVEIPVSEAVKSGDYYVFTCEVAAKEMTSVIEAKLVTSESELQLDDYTVQEYAEVILSDTVKYAKEQELVKKMLNYGAEAQIYFNYNTDNLANDTELMTEEEKITELYGFAGAPFTLEGEETGVTYYGTALSLETELAFKHYFIIDESVDTQSLEITCNYPVTLKKNGSFYELTISDIPAHKMGESSMVVTIGGITLDYTIYSYGALVQNSGNEELWTVVSALAQFAGEATMYTYK